MGGHYSGRRPVPSIPKIIAGCREVKHFSLPPHAQVTLERLAGIVGGLHRQVAGRHLEEFRAWGEDFRGVMTRKRQVNERVVEAVRQRVCRDPLVLAQGLCHRPKGHLGWEDLSAANIETAWSRFRPETSVRANFPLDLSGG